MQTSTTVVSFQVEVVDGEGLPVPGAEVGARYRYEEAPRTWSSEYTDGEGYARFRDTHVEEPIEVILFVGDEECASVVPVEGANIVLEM